MNTGLFLMTSDADSAEKMKQVGYQLISQCGDFFVFIDNPDIKFNFEHIGVCRTNKLIFK